MIYFLFIFFVMRIFVYKTITVVLAVALLSISALAVVSFSMFLNQPTLSDDAVRAYERQICDLQEKMDYPSCFVGGETIYFDAFTDSGSYP